MRKALVHLGRHVVWKGGGWGEGGEVMRSVFHFFFVPENSLSGDWLRVLVCILPVGPSKR